MKSERILITGGAGFIGSNLAHQLIGEGHEVSIYDNLSRSGCQSNIDWLDRLYGPDAYRLVVGDVTDFNTLKQATVNVDRIYHLAGQVAVTTSVKDPRRDFEENALGTFNALEAARQAGTNPIFLYASTNKVYGNMEDTAVIEDITRYRYVDSPYGIPENKSLDFHSPYGCSKGAGDQYTRDYHRIFGLRTVVVRQSCIYGYRQFGLEDQGWVAWFIIAVLKGRQITIYGNGKQVRDILFIDDLLAAYNRIVEKIEVSAGEVYNIGGGPHNTMSIWTEFGPILEDLIGQHIPVDFADWRPGDQPVFISDIRKSERELSWHPQISVSEGIRRLYKWIQNHKELFSNL